MYVPNLVYFLPDETFDVEFKVAHIKYVERHIVEFQFAEKQNVGISFCGHVKVSNIPQNL
jgi:hypothetical protein